MSSCEGDATTIGSKLLPPSDFINIKSTDTLDVRSFTMYGDSVESDNPSVSYLGSLYDPYFGRTTAEFVTQIRLDNAWTETFYEVDSVTLYLTLLNVSGAVNQHHQIKMSEISQQIFSDSTYYSNQNVLLTGNNWTIDLPDSLQADTVNNIEMKVPASFGEYLMRDTSQFFYDDSEQDFRSYFKGLYFQLVSPQDPIMFTLSVAPPSYSVNYFVVYMHDEYNQSFHYAFDLDARSTNAAFNRYIHDFNAAESDKMILHINDTNYLDTLSYAQSMNGLYTKLSIPGLKLIKNDPSMDGVKVNKARLIFPVVYDGDIYKRSTIPSQVYLRYRTSTGTKSIIPDYVMSPSFFDGTPDTTTDVYNLNLAAYVQGYLEDKANTLKPEFDLFLSSSASNNAILKANKSHTPVKFELTWTKF